MYFLAFYKRSKAQPQSFLAVTQDLTEPLRMLPDGVDRDRENGHAVGDVVRVRVEPTGRTFTGEITVIQPDGRYSIDMSDDPQAFSCVEPKEVQEVLEESKDHKPRLMGVVMLPKKSSAEKVRSAICDFVGHDPVADWWDVAPQRLRAVGKSLGEDVWIYYDTSFTLEEFQAALLE